MSLLEEFEDLMADEVVVEPFVSQDAYGAATYGEPATLRARVEIGPQMVVTAQGREVVSSGRVYVGEAVDVRDRITLPADVPVRQPSILRVDMVRDETGPHHWKVYT